jgi:hypothetical protein
MKIIKLSLALLTLMGTAYAEEEHRDRLHSVKKAIGNVHETEQKELNVVDGFSHMFRDAQATGQIRSMYSGIQYKNAQDIYATAIGGFLKYELAEYKGFSGAVEFVTSQNINFLSGDGVRYNDELASSNGDYTQMSELYINYAYENFAFRGGRQTIDTPLADSDDIRMVSNSFEAYIASYELDTIMFEAGYLVSWQGYDAGLETPWEKTGKDGTYLAGIIYSDDNLDANIWYYNINGEMNDATANNSYYGDIIGHYHISKDIFLHAGIQYLQQDELDKSGVASSIYGGTAELVVYGLGLNIAYNKADKKSAKGSFSGFGGGTLFTSMDSMILDVIAIDRDADAVVAGISYELGDFNFLYAYGDFNGDADSSGVTEHIVEQNLGVAYEHNEVTLGAIYTKNSDKKNTNSNDGDWDNLRVLIAYNF